MSEHEVTDERAERREDQRRILNSEEPPLDPSQPTGNTDGPGPEQAPADVGTTSPGTARGENQVSETGKEAGRTDEGTEGKTERPVGSSDPRDMTGIIP